MNQERRALDRREAAQMYSTTYGTLSNLASRGLGPKFFRRGKKCLYRVADLDKFFFANPIETSDSMRAGSAEKNDSWK